jgi:hypothetical protein
MVIKPAWLLFNTPLRGASPYIEITLSLVIIDVSMPPYLAAPLIKSGAAHTMLSAQLRDWNA